MKFLFYFHSEKNVASLHVNEDLPKNELDTLPDMMDSDRDKAQKEQTAQHTMGGVMITKERASEEWVKPVYREVLTIPGISAVALKNCYELVIFKGEMFEWKQLTKRIAAVIAEALGTSVDKVDAKPCPDCHEGGHGGGGGMVRAMKMVLGPGGMQKVEEIDLGGNDEDDVEKMSEADKGRAIEKMLDQLLARAEKLGAYVCCVIDHVSVGPLCAERVPPKNDKSRKKLASVAMSEAYDAWSQARSKNGKINLDADPESEATAKDSQDSQDSQELSEDSPQT